MRIRCDVGVVNIMVEYCFLRWQKKKKKRNGVWMGTFCRLHEKEIRNNFSILFFLYCIQNEKANQRRVWFVLTRKVLQTIKHFCDTRQTIHNSLELTVFVIAPWHHLIIFIFGTNKKNGNKYIFHIWRALLPHSLSVIIWIEVILSPLSHRSNTSNCARMFAMCTYPCYCFLWVNYLYLSGERKENFNICNRCWLSYSIAMIVNSINHFVILLVSMEILCILSLEDTLSALKQKLVGNQFVFHYAHLMGSIRQKCGCRWYAAISSMNESN